MASKSIMSTTSKASHGGPKGISYIAALRLVEEREASIRKVFDKFDLDKSGSVDMDELMVVLEELGMLIKLRTDNEEFCRDMFVKYDTNYDGVLQFGEFLGLYNAALDDSLGRRKKEPSVGHSKGGASSTQEARKRIAAEKAAKKAAEASRILQQNAEMKARIMATGKGKDPKVLDAEVERQRRELAQARADAKAAERARLNEENAAMAERRRNVKAAVDHDITDDVAYAADGTMVIGAGRDAAAEASRTRKAAEAAQLATENEKMRQMIANTGAWTDNDITDDVAVGADGTTIVGAGRDAAAAASKARKEAEAARLAADNANLFERIRSTGAATDNDITDDVRVASDGTVVMGGGRDAAAAAARARKVAEDAQLTSENDRMRQRIAATGAATANRLS